MKTLLKLGLVMMMASLLMVGCTEDEEDDPVVVGTFSDLSTYMQENDLDLPTMIGAGWVKAAYDIVDTNDYSIPGYTILDIRAAADFSTGHIAGAINTSFADILSAAEANAEGDNGYLIVCYSGQTAAHASMALKLMGYNSVVLKFGMSGWNEAFAGPWNGNSGHDNGNNALDHANWVTTAAPALETYDYPAWETEPTDGVAILTERVEAAIAAGFLAVDGHGTAGVLENVGNYQLLNFWNATDYIAYGHYDGAYQLNPISLAGDEVVAIDPDMTSAIYCYTGQTSSMVTFWLNVLGYDAKSIKYGVNALNWDGLYEDGKPNFHGAMDYDFVTGS